MRIPSPPGDLKAAQRGARREKGGVVKTAEAASESIYTARMTLKQWLQALEDAGLLKPGATLRILTNRKLKRVSLTRGAAE